MPLYSVIQYRFEAEIPTTLKCINNQTPQDAISDNLIANSFLQFVLAPSCSVLKFISEIGSQNQAK